MIATRTSAPFFLLTLLGAFAARAHAQTAYYVFDGDNLSENLGFSVSKVGDVNGDGFADILAGVRGANSNGPDAGAVRVYSGVDGAVLYNIAGDQPGDLLGISVSGTGDVNGDGTPDFIAGASMSAAGAFNGGMARVYSGFDGSVLYTFLGTVMGERFGLSVSGAGDVNGDGFNDFIAGSPRSSQAAPRGGKARVYSGFDGAVLYEYLGTGLFEEVGFSMSEMGDLNSDGFDDFAIGARARQSPVNSHIDIYSGADGSLLHQFFGSGALTNLGASVALAGDVNGDGFDDFIGGATGTGNNRGSARVWSGFDDSVLYTFNGFSPSDNFGGSVAGAGDQNGDGFAEIMIGAGSLDNTYSGGNGYMQMFSGVDGTLMRTLRGASTHDRFGISLDLVGDVNGDGVDEFVVGASGEDNFHSASGSVRVFTLAPIPFEYQDLCNGDGGDQMGCVNCPCGNNAPVGTIGGCLHSSLTSSRLHAAGSASVSLPPDSTADLRFRLSGGPATAFSRLVSGTAVGPMSPANPCFGSQNGAQSVHFDGVRCAITAVLRHGGRVVDAGGNVGAAGDPWGGEGAPAAGVAGLSGFVAGHTRYFQVIHRDFPQFTCMTGQNTSQAIRVLFRP